MTVRVEFYGIVRQRAGVAAAEAEGATLGELLAEVSRQFPQVAESCLDGSRLRTGYLASLNGIRFTTDPAESLSHGDTVLILSADAGG